MFEAKDYRETLSVLLATQSMKLFPSGDVARILQNTTLGVPIGYIADQAVTVVAISPDGSYAASGRNDKIMHIWDVKEAKGLAIPHNGPVTAIAFSADGTQLVSASCEEMEASALCPNAYIRVWEVQTGQQVAQTNHPGFINSVAFSPDGTQVVFGGDDTHNLHLY